MSKTSRAHGPDVDISETLTPENAKRFLAGEITWAELAGVTPMAFASAAIVARHLYTEGKTDDAKLILQALALANPRNAYVWVGLGAACQLMGELDEARDAYDRALALEADYPEALFNRAELALEEEDRAGARADLQRVVVLGAGEPEVLDRAKALLGQLDESV